MTRGVIAAILLLALPSAAAQNSVSTKLLDPPFPPPSESGANGRSQSTVQQANAPDSEDRRLSA